jgi:hypothetical protein
LPPLSAGSGRLRGRAAAAVLAVLGFVWVPVAWVLGWWHVRENTVYVTALERPRPADDDDGDLVLLEPGHPDDGLQDWVLEPWPGEVLVCSFAGPARRQDLAVDRGSWVPQGFPNQVTTDRWVRGRPSYVSLSYRLVPQSFAGHHVRLNPPALETAWGQVKPTHLALLVRADPKGMTRRFKLEIKRGHQGFEKYVDDRIDPGHAIASDWSWVLVELKAFGGLPRNGAGLTEIVFCYESAEASQMEGGLHLARLSFVNKARWAPRLPPGANRVQLAPPMALSEPKPAAPEWVLADFARSDRGEGFLQAYGSWQTDATAETRDRWLGGPGRLALTYRVPPGAAPAGHFFKINGAGLSNAVGAARPTHLLLRARSAAELRRFRVEIKQPEACAYKADASSRPAELIPGQWTDVLLPLQKFEGFQPDRLGDVTEVVTVFASDEADPGEGSLEVARISLVSRP